MLVPCIVMLAAPRMIVGLYLDLTAPRNQGTAAVAVQPIAVAALFQVFDGIQVIAAGTSAGLLAPYVMGSVIENAATPLDGFNTGFIICGVVMLIGGAVGVALIRPEREASRWTNDRSELAIRSA